MENNSKLRKLIRESIMEEMGKEMRYVATMNFYVWANSDQDAAEQAKSIASDLDMNLDNRASITGLVKQEHGTFGNTPVEFNEGIMKTLKRKFAGVSDEQAAYNEKHGLPDTWRGTKEGYYEKQGDGNSRPSGSNE
jgi:hypothetical protein